MLKDEDILNELFPLVNEIETLPSAVRNIIKTAIDWHAYGNRHASDLNRFVNYWESIELLGHFFYRKLTPEIVQRKTTNEKKDMIINLLKEKVTQDNCMNIVEKCNEIRMPTVRTKVLAYLAIIADRDEMEDLLFNPDDRTEKSLYKIRNDIAHGNLSEHHFETIESFKHRLYDAQKISRQIILLSIENAEKLAQELTK